MDAGRISKDKPLTMRIILLGICYTALLVIIHSCSRIDNNLTSKVTDSLSSSVAIQDSTDNADLKEILSTRWIEVLNENEEWLIDDPCDSGIPELNIQNDTINLSFGDGGFNSYQIVAKEKNLQKIVWRLITIELLEDPDRRGDTTVIFVKVIDEDKTFWTIGEGLNPYNFTFLKSEFADEYPRRKNDCSEFEKE
jgi:hypothetical protein